MNFWKKKYRCNFHHFWRQNSNIWISFFSTLEIYIFFKNLTLGKKNLLLERRKIDVQSWSWMWKFEWKQSRNWQKCDFCFFCPVHIVWKLLKMLHFNFWIFPFSTNFCPIKIDLSGNTVWPQASGFKKTRQNWPFLAVLMNFCPLKM